MTKKNNDRILTVTWIAGGAAILLLGIAMGFLAPWIEQIGRASCRERV